MPDQLHARVAAFLDTQHVMSLATAGPNGPHAANLFYVRDGLGLVWVSDAGSRHSLDIASNPAVAATVAPDTAEHAAVRGVQMHGRAARVDNAAEAQRLRAALAERYPFLKELARAPEALRVAFAQVAVYRLDPDDVVLIDNSRGFGHKERLMLRREG
jgi:uncharacterized protein YhbP (UPF0306 family)